MFEQGPASPKNLFQKKLRENTREAGNPPVEADRITYGIISDVDYKIGQVKVKQLDADGRVGKEISESFLPLATPISEVHLLWGALRKGLVVRVYWRGRLNPRNVIIEVIGDEDHSFLKKEPEFNEIPIGPYKIFSGGMF